jgi:hypothetical protein
MKTLVVSLAAFSLFGFGHLPVFAQTISTELTGSPSTTAFSGRGGANRTLSKSASMNDAIYGVEIAERSDDPCFLRIKYRDVASGAEGSSLRFAECSDNNNNEGTSDSRRGVSLPSGAFVTGVRICLNADRDKMKGIQLLGRYGGCLLGQEKVYVAPAACSPVFKVSGHEYRLCNTDQPNYVGLDCSQTSTSVSDHYERTNCPGTKEGPDRDWETRVSCPDLMVATGMKLSTRQSGGGREMIDGIALECHRLALPN